MRRARYARMVAKRRIDRTRAGRRARLVALWTAPTCAVCDLPAGDLVRVGGKPVHLSCLTAGWFA